ncbi:unnamed protein product [Parajaminaea phylloscopi]
MAATLAPSASSSGPTFCVRCGDPIPASRQRCTRCGALGTAPRVKGSIGRSEGGSQGKDPWVSRYLAGIGGEELASQQDTYTDTALYDSTLPGKHSTAVLATLPSSRTAFSLGIGMPSSISRDLRPSTPSLSKSTGSEVSASLNKTPQKSQPTSTSTSTSVPAHLPNTPASPIIHDSSGGLTKVVGSLVEPVASRNKWACSDCESVFARDSTIYVPPASAAVGSRPNGDGKEDFFCKGCYTARYALGTCSHPACGKPVLGSTKDTGVYVKAGQKVYHGTCFRCLGCDAGPPTKANKGSGTVKEVMLDLNGHPSCEDCFGRIPKDPRPLGKVKHSSEVGNPTAKMPSRSKGADRDPDMDSTIAELADRLGRPLTGGPRSRSRSPLKRPDPARAEVSSKAGVETKHQGGLEDVAASVDVNTMTCSQCGQGAFGAPGTAPGAEALLVVLPSSHCVHASCFNCAVCTKSLDAEKPFVKLDRDAQSSPAAADPTLPSWAHPSCAPRDQTTVDWDARDGTSTEKKPTFSALSARKTVATLHPTQQRLPRPSFSEGPTAATSGGNPPAVHSFIQRSSSPLRGTSPERAPGTDYTPASEAVCAAVRPAPSVRQFKPSSGAAPPTRSTLNVHRPGGVVGSHSARGIFASGSVGVVPLSHGQPSSAGSSSPGRRSPTASPVAHLGVSHSPRYGGMQTCAGCAGRLTSLESVPGPAGSSWHRKCLVCKASKPAPPVSRYSVSANRSPALCGKQLDSFAKVREDGDVRCASCYREGL